MILIENDAPGLLEHWQNVAGSRVQVQALNNDTWRNPMSANPSMIVLGGGLQGCSLQVLGWDAVPVPIIGFMGDACCWSDYGQVCRNMPCVTELYCSGVNWYHAIKQHSSGNEHKFRYHHLCAEWHTPPLKLPKRWDWSFIGQTYGIHSRRTVAITELLKVLPNGYVAGDGWSKFNIIPDAPHNIPVEQVNEIYAQSTMVLSVDIDDGLGYTSNRTIMSMCGEHNTLILEHNHMQPLKDIVKHGVHALYYKDTAEAADYIAQVKSGLDLGAEARKLVIDQHWTLTGWINLLLGKHLNI